MALWRARIACPPRALDSLGPAAGRVPLPSGSFRLHVFVLFYKPITPPWGEQSLVGIPTYNLQGVKDMFVSRLRARIHIGIPM